MLAAFLIAALVAIVVSVVFRLFAPEYAAPAALISFLVVLLINIGVL